MQKRYPVVEIFGPTIQGEGTDQGMPCDFIRFGGCDYKCDWCDTPHAVLPQSVRHAPRMTTQEILDKVSDGPARLVVLSGGNPLLHQLGELVSALRSAGKLVSVETQGTLWKPWITRVDRVAVSPKPPSSGEMTDFTVLDKFLTYTWSAVRSDRVFLKVVVFDQGDYEYAREIHRRYPLPTLYLSAGNDAGATVGNPDRVDERSTEQVVNDLISRGRWLANRVMVDPDMATTRVQMQQHVLYWGNERGK